MVDFLRLIRNENMKIYRRPRLYIFLGILIGLIVTVSVLWLAFSNTDTSMWHLVMVEFTFLYVLVTIFSVIVAAGSVAEEFSTGTIKLLLIRPWSRSNILLSKYTASLGFTLFLSLVMLASTLLINWLCFEAFSPTVPSFQIDGMNGTPNFQYLLKYSGLTLLTSIMTITVSFMLSTIFRSNALAIGIALFLELIVNSTLQLLIHIDKKWVDYVLFVHLNLTRYLNGTVAEDGMTLGFSLSVLGVYYVIFILITWLIFNKRDVAV